MKYEASVDLSNKNNSHTVAADLVQSVGPAPLRVLEVGCASGYLGGVLRRLGHHVTGVEPDAASVEVARGRLNEVFCGTAEAYFRSQPDARFDVIVFGDVLEHLQDPADALSLCRTYLASNGALIASVPNVAHASVRAMLLSGRWAYGELGILDRTHLKFFSRDSFVSLLSQCGYAVHRLVHTHARAAEVNKTFGMGVSDGWIAVVEVFAKDAYRDTFQFVALAKPALLGASAELVGQNLAISDEWPEGEKPVGASWSRRTRTWFKALGMLFGAAHTP